LNLNTPEFTDADGDGFDDFFDVKKGASATTSGIYQFDAEGITRNVTAEWSRAAGSASGTCVITLQGYGDYTHVFELLEYRGTLAYNPGSLSVTGSVQLTNSLNTSEMLHGPATFVKSISDPANLLRLQAAFWTNALGESLPFAANDYIRDNAWPTNYYGYFDFDDDGDINTLQPYGTWYLSFDDLNDADGDKIPNFSDTPPAGVVQEPELALRPGGTNLVLTIAGDSGRSYEIQWASTVRPASWQPEVTVTLTNSSQAVTLPRPGETRFWRVKVK
jgi:hypothetical protein